MLENRLGLMSPSDSGHVAEGTRQSNVKIHPPPTPPASPAHVAARIEVRTELEQRVLLTQSLGSYTFISTTQLVPSWVGGMAWCRKPRCQEHPWHSFTVSGLTAWKAF